MNRQRSSQPSGAGITFIRAYYEWREEIVEIRFRGSAYGQLANAAATVLVTGGRYSGLPLDVDASLQRLDSVLNEQGLSVAPSR